MPQKDNKGRYCGVVDIEEEERSAKFVRRYLRLDRANKVVEWFTDNPSTLPNTPQAQGTIDVNFITKVDIPVKLKFKAKNCFFIHTPPRRYYFQAINDKDMREWVEILDSASKIVVSSDEDSVDVIRTQHIDQSSTPDPTTAYTTEIVAGVVIQKQLVSEEPPAPEEESSSFRSSSLQRGNSPKKPSAVTGNILKKGWGIKQGHLRKNWKRRYFVISDQSFSYFHSDLVKDPIRTIPAHAILAAKKDTSPLSENRENLILVATTERKYFIQVDSNEEMNDWIKSFHDASHLSHSVKRRSKELLKGINKGPDQGAPAKSTNHVRKLDVSLSLAPTQRNSSYLGSSNSPTIPSSRLSCADETFHMRPTSVAEASVNQHLRQLRNASSSEDSSGLGGSVDSLSHVGQESKPLIKKKSPKQHSGNTRSKVKDYQRSMSGTEILPNNAAAKSSMHIGGNESPKLPLKDLPKTSVRGSFSASNASSPRSSGSFSSLQSPRSSKLLQLDPSVDHRAAVKPSNVKKKKNTGIMFSLNNMLNKKANKISSEKRPIKLK